MCKLNELTDLFSEEQLQALQNQGVMEVKSLVSLWVTPGMDLEIADLLGVSLEEFNEVIDEIAVRCGDLALPALSEHELADRLGCLELPDNEVLEKGGEPNVEADGSVDEIDQLGSE
jgi:hypothetical protein